MGVGRQEPGIAVYSRKVLIKAKAEGVLPEWMRFLKGVVDSEDIPLNISREHMQDSGLIKRVGNVVARWLLGQLAREAKKDEKKYLEFYNEFGSYIKEGACADNEHREAISKLLRFDSSVPAEGGVGVEQTSLATYSERVAPGQVRQS
jgi:HSP90 family molecular chaperone